jgi:hypothetical protein
VPTPAAHLASILRAPKAVGKPAVSGERLQESLTRIIDVDEQHGPPVTPGPAKMKKPPEKPPVKGKQFPLEHHLGGKPAAMVDIFEQVDEFARSLGADVSRRIRKFYVGDYAGKRSFLTVEIQRQRLILYLNLDPTTATPWNEEPRGPGPFGLSEDPPHDRPLRSTSGSP